MSCRLGARGKCGLFTDALLSRFLFGSLDDASLYRWLERQILITTDAKLLQTQATIPISLDVPLTHLLRNAWLWPGGSAGMPAIDPSWNGKSRSQFDVTVVTA